MFLLFKSQSSSHLSSVLPTCAKHNDSSFLLTIQLTVLTANAGCGSLHGHKHQKRGKLLQLLCCCSTDVVPVYCLHTVEADANREVVDMLDYFN